VVDSGDAIINTPTAVNVTGNIWRALISLAGIGEGQYTIKVFLKVLMI